MLNNVFLGSLDIKDRLDHVPLVKDFKTAETRLRNVNLWQFVYEIGHESKMEFLPPALHPTNPPVVFLQNYEVEDSEWGPFRMLHARVGSRAGVRLRGFMMGCLIDNPKAAEALAARWGFPCEIAEIQSKSFYYDSLPVTALVNGKLVFDARLMAPQPIAAETIFYSANSHLVRTPQGPQLIQVDLEYEFHKADRGKPKIAYLDSKTFFGRDGVRLTWPVSASFSRTDVVISGIRYVSDPDRPAVQGTRNVAGEAVAANQDAL